MNFMCYSKFLISSYMKLDLVVLDNVVLNVITNTLYYLISITSSSSTFLFFFFCSLFLYNSCIF